MKITILPQGTLAIYEQIVNQLKNAIVTGGLKAGEALPSIRSLAAELSVSVITTKRAYVLHYKILYSEVTVRLHRRKPP